MSKYIDADALMKKFSLDSNGNRMPEVDVDNFPITETLADIKQIIREMPAADVEPVRKWISVDERLPEPGTDVLVYKRWEGMITHNIYFKTLIAQLLIDGRWETEGMKINGDVIAWMDLPEPPKMDGGGECLS